MPKKNAENWILELAPLCRLLPDFTHSLILLIVIKLISIFITPRSPPPFPTHNNIKSCCHINYAQNISIYTIFTYTMAVIIEIVLTHTYKSQWRSQLLSKMIPHLAQNNLVCGVQCTRLNKITPRHWHKVFALIWNQFQAKPAIRNSW